MAEVPPTVLKTFYGLMRPQDASLDENRDHWFSRASRLLSPVAAMTSCTS
jgi:hypothetical protein